jgi:hypothetical protein
VGGGRPRFGGEDRHAEPGFGSEIHTFVGEGEIADDVVVEVYGAARAGADVVGAPATPYSTLIWARAATSLRRSPGTRRCPTSDSPACCGVILARRDVRNSRTSTRLSTSMTVRPSTGRWDALSVHLSTATFCLLGRRVPWMS